MPTRARAATANAHCFFLMNSSFKRG
jgi:hypothetical protein